MKNEKLRKYTARMLSTKPARPQIFYDLGLEEDDTFNLIEFWRATSLAKLSSRATFTVRDVLNMRYSVDGNVRVTYNQIGQVHGFTAQCARARVKRALKRMQRPDMLARYSDAVPQLEGGKPLRKQTQEEPNGHSPA